MLTRFFELDRLQTTISREVVAGATTFLAMAYIAFVNPAILSAAGIDHGAAFVATCLAAAIGSLVMGLAANYPIALAPGMGLNAYFAYTVVKGLGYSWQVGLGAVFISGCIFLALSILRVREWIIDAIPRPLKLAISAGIGLFLAIIGLKNAGIVVDSPATLVTLGDLGSAPALLAACGFVVIVALDARKVPGAVLIGILGVTGISIAVGASKFAGLVAAPPSIAPTFLQLDIAGALEAGALVIVFTFLFVDLFDTAGTLVGVAHRAGMLTDDGKLPRIGRALLADSTATIAGSLLGTSTTTSYIESTLGVQAGGRSGLTAVVVALCFLLCLFLAPLASTVPAFATAPALVYIACLMARGLAELDWDDATDYAPAVITALAMPLTFSIATGIGFGFVAWTGVKILAGRWTDVNAAVVVVSGLFVVKWAVM